MAACRDDGIAPSEIKGMDYPELKYWSDWYFVKQRTTIDEIKKARNGK